MKRFINELKYLNRGMPTSTKIILGVIVAYIFYKFWGEYFIQSINFY